MLKIRLSRIGKKSQPAYRIIVQEHTNAPQGKAIEVIGHYRPTMDPKELVIDLERAKYWISVGAQPSDTVAVLLKKEGLDGMDKFIAPRNKQRKPKKEVEEPEAPAAEAAPAEGGEAAPEPAAAEEPAKEEGPAPAEEKPAEQPAKEEPPAEEPKEEAKEENKEEEPQA